jgi:3-oxoacyl-[acyl-carrier protein] reductase
VVLATREASKYFGPEGGSVINLGSVVSETTPAFSAVYTGSKAAVDAMTRVLAKELGPRKIRVNSLNPGGVETEGAHSAGVIGTEFQKNMVARTPLGRFGQPGDIAPVAVFLASDDSAWLTGEVLVASGGYR